MNTHSRRAVTASLGKSLTDEQLDIVDTFCDLIGERTVLKIAKSCYGLGGRHFITRLQREQRDLTISV